MATTLLPRTARPSYKSGYARSAGESANPGLWRGLAGAWVPLGNTGLLLRNVVTGGADAVFGAGVSSSNWIATEKGLAVDYEGGANDIVNISDVVFSGTTGTLMAWATNDGASIYDGLVTTKDTSSWDGNGVVIYSHSSTQIRVKIQSYYSASITVGLAEWHHYSASFDGTDLRLHVDGRLVSTVAASGATMAGSSSNMTFGNFYTSAAANLWDGRIGTVLAYDRVLPDAEIRKHAADHLAPFRRKPLVISIPAAAPGGGRIMSSIVGAGGLAGSGGIAGSGGGLAG